MRDRDEPHLLLTRSQPEAGQASGAKGDESLGDLVARCGEGIRQGVGQVGGDPLCGIGGLENQEVEGPAPNEKADP